MRYKAGFLGTGAMGGALARAVSKGLEPGQLAGYDLAKALLDKVAADTGLTPLADPLELSDAEVVFLAVKPQVWKEAVQPLYGKLGAQHLVVSLMAGVPASQLALALPGTRIIRLMPNSPALVGEGAIAAAAGPGSTADDLLLVKALLADAGLVVEVAERHMDAVTGLSGSGPAYVYMVIEALADGGVLCGLDRATSLKLAAQTVLGAARMVLETGEEPATLKAKVTSPGGTTIEGLAVLEESAVRSAFMEAVRAAKQRSEELGRK